MSHEILFHTADCECFECSIKRKIQEYEQAHENKITCKYCFHSYHDQEQCTAPYGTISFLNQSSVQIMQGNGLRCLCHAENQDGYNQALGKLMPEEFRK